MKKVSKYWNATKPPAKPSQPTKVPPKPKERVYKHRIFNYRGITFLAVAKDAEYFTLAVFDPITNTPGPNIVVAEKNLHEAKKALAKLIIAEQALSKVVAGDDSDKNY